MTSNELRAMYLQFFQDRGHAVIPSSPLVPENDPTTLFTSSGMQPLVPYLLGEKHPLGTRLVNSQKSFRSQDIDEVGDNRHTTFFEMLGNWSLGDYFKSEQIPWFFEFLTDALELNPKQLYVSVFEGNRAVPKDTESMELWKTLFAQKGIDAREGERIFPYPAEKNWWSRSGIPDQMPTGEPGGPDSEVFFDFGEELRLHEQSHYRALPCHPNCDCGRFLEIGNSVFMQYVKGDGGNLTELQQKNVDFGGGLERHLAAKSGTPDVFRTDLFTPIVDRLSRETAVQYGADQETTKSLRIIADHVKAAVMIIADGVLPSNKMQGYVLRRLIRRSLLHGRILGAGEDGSFVSALVEPVGDMYAQAYPDVTEKQEEIRTVLLDETDRFRLSLKKGLREIETMQTLDGKTAFFLYETYGFPWELTAEIAQKRGIPLERHEFEKEFEKHKNESRSSAQGIFRGGLADAQVETTKLHTAHHLLLTALQKTVSPDIRQRGSNITADRLRIDVAFPRSITHEELVAVEKVVNEAIARDYPVTRLEVAKSEAEALGAQMEFGHKYPPRVTVYIVGLAKDVKPEDARPGDYFSAEFCGGPHVERTGLLGHFRIQKEKSAGSGIRRIYAVLS